MRVSVAFCTYNGDKYLRPQLESILDQTRPPDEIVVSDDGSTDRTLEILDEYQQAHPNLFEIHVNERNRGVAGNFEECLRRCSGDAIGLCDQDDVWRQHKLERQVNAMADTGAGLVFHDSEITDESLTPVASHWDLCGYEHGAIRTPETALDELLRTGFVKGSSILLSESLRDRALPLPYPWPHDYFLAFVAALTDSVQDIDDQLHQYRRHDDQDSPPRTKSPLRKLRHMRRQLDNSAFDRRVEMWDALLNRLEAFDDDVLSVDRKIAQQRIRARRAFDRSRRSIYNDSTPRHERCRCLMQNLRDSRYSQFGKSSFNPWLYVLKDLAVAMLLSSAGEDGDRREKDGTSEPS